MTRALLVLAAAALLLLAGAAQANDVSGCGGFVETSSLPKLVDRFPSLLSLASLPSAHFLHVI